MHSHKLKTILAASLAFTGIIGASSASATAHLNVAASSIIIQTYSGTTPALWYTGSPCINGGLQMDPSESVDRHKLLWAIVLAAKSYGGTIGIDYDVGAGPICVIRHISANPN